MQDEEQEEKDRQRSKATTTTTRTSTREDGNNFTAGADGDECEEASMYQDTSFTDAAEGPSLQMSRSPSAGSTSSSGSTLSTDDEKLLVKTVAPEKRVSIYVQVFEEMLNTVLEYESHLFNEEELEMLARFKTMSCESWCYA